MKVMKFGGTSVGSVDSILKVKQIVEAAEEPVIVVVSALGGITDKLINTSQMAANGDAEYEKEYREIVNRHIEMVYTVIPAGEGRTVLLDKVNELLSELKDIFQGIYLIKDLSTKTSATIVSYGERLSSIIAATLIKGAVWYDSRNFIKTEKKHAKHILDSELTTSLVKETFDEIPQVALVPGFISTDKNSGEVTNLGRGGSDYTASIIAASLNAASLEIWTDVDGFMTADPRVISTAYTINELSYVEAMELCNFGAKVVYPPTIYPVCHKNIPILIKNTFNPEAPGTIIKQEVDSGSKAIKGISSINDTTLITVTGLGMVGVIGVNFRIFKALAQNGISVFMVSQASSENSTSIGVRNQDAALACEVLNEEFAKEIEMGEISPVVAEMNLATIAIVGEEIWTDVDGFMTADPRVISTAYTINELSYVEAMELCNFGAKVVYPPTIYPVCHKNIPILIKNTFNPEAPGTIIKQEVDSGSKAIKGISSINDTTLITVTGLGMVGVIGVNFRIFKALAQNGISVFMVSQASSENSTSIGVRNQDAALACEVLNEEFAKEIEMGEISPVVAEMNLATIAIVGENMKHTPGIAGKLFGTLGRNGISVIACAQGASETNISFVVEAKSLRKSLNVIHDSFFLSEYQVLNLFICGTGTVGGSLIEQIRCQQQKLMQERGLKLKVVGIADGHRALFTRAGIDLASYREEMEEKGIPSSAAVLHDEIIGMNIFNSVFVDCTASAEVASLYKEFLMHNISVVAANKIAASSDYSIYSELKQIARRRGVKFLFETNVGAGLPIINTINDLINSGDKILKIEAVLSGTLNYIFNKISADVPFSQTIKMAQEERYSEPDPRIDLSGKDVIRKLVILAREAGYKLEQTDVEKHLFVPSDFFEGPLEEFWKKVPSLDADFEARRRKLESENKRWRFVAKLENGKGSVSLQEVDSKHPFYGLEGSNNIILLTTERYKEYPMMIQGYGAGASVTAAGVFADIMSIANI